ncbi:MAG: bifunctional adenosylcobinamide kinase/adenosylcobinamide-phosphate guanylyltransferase [Mangrovicoccus sp.]|nr:bifunctional adenosylcobinamide kinase/adenosylcobinamide-phosphate guanylyltransferase [Mangrovicoccus sp.]
MLPHLTLILGGANSGKSAYAEALCCQSGLSRIYIATAQAFDDEMRQKIARHQHSRGTDWHTVEAPLDLAPALASATAEQVILLDCATLWLSNHLLAGNDLDAQSDGLLRALAKTAAPVVVVSNEVGQGVVPESPMGRAFRSAQGRLNQALAAQAAHVVAVMAGLPLVLKDTRP